MDKLLRSFLIETLLLLTFLLQSPGVAFSARSEDGSRLSSNPGNLTGRGSVPRCAEPPIGPEVESAPNFRLRVSGGKTRNIGKPLAVQVQSTEDKTDYVSIMDREFRALGINNAVCSSAYRSARDQIRACQSVCKDGASNCENNCAAACTSQHQKEIAVCDIVGIPGDSRSVCLKLKGICDRVFEGKCGIGGYYDRPGVYHFGAGLTLEKFSAWEACGFLTNGTQMAQQVVARSNQQVERIRSR